VTPNRNTGQRAAVTFVVVIPGADRVSAIARNVNPNWMQNCSGCPQRYFGLLADLLGLDATLLLTYFGWMQRCFDWMQSCSCCKPTYFNWMQSCIDWSQTCFRYNKTCFRYTDLI
jgi:hypothetical protein